MEIITALHVFLFIAFLVSYFFLYCFFAFSFERKFQRERRQNKANYLKLRKESEERQRELENLTRLIEKQLGYALPKNKTDSSSLKIN